MMAQKSRNKKAQYIRELEERLEAAHERILQLESKLQTVQSTDSLVEHVEMTQDPLLFCDDDLVDE